MRISDWSSDVCSSDLILGKRLRTPANSARREWLGKSGIVDHAARLSSLIAKPGMARLPALTSFWPWSRSHAFNASGWACRSEEHTSELHSLMRISYAVFCLKKKTNYSTDTQFCITTHTSLHSD